MQIGLEESREYRVWSREKNPEFERLSLTPDSRLMTPDFPPDS